MAKWIEAKGTDGDKLLINTDTGTRIYANEVGEGENPTLTLETERDTVEFVGKYDDVRAALIPFAIS